MQSIVRLAKKGWFYYTWEFWMCPIDQLCPIDCSVCELECDDKTCVECDRYINCDTWKNGICCECNNMHFPDMCSECAQAIADRDQADYEAAFYPNGCLICDAPLPKGVEYCYHHRD